MVFLIVEGIWPNAAFLDGVGINALISAEPALPNGGAVFHDTKVWIKKEEKLGRKESALWRTTVR